MAFRVPNFNLDVNLWRYPDVWTDPPSLQFKANLARGERDYRGPQYPTSGTLMVSEMMLLCPAGTDIRFEFGPPNDPDLVEVPAGSGRYYQVVVVDDCAKGFANEYRFAVLWQLTNSYLDQIGNPWGVPDWPVPMP